MFDRFEADVRNRAVVEGGVPPDDLRERFDDWLISEGGGGSGKQLSVEELEYRQALGVA